ncbi:MAG: hypothetical protein DME66_05495 [Verrucomicrobia bacterium]|nr:MAG: hypothetical protein DME66_05495 [Verrucomicrobiota bacterium]
MNSFIVRLNFHGDLPFFLGSKRRREVIERRLTEKTSVKDVIESCGVPHPEADLILVNGQPVDFYHTLRANVDVDVYPAGFSPTFFTNKRLQITHSIKFLADGHLGRLSRSLRLLGLDVAYFNAAEDRQLLETMQRENRALLTRDRRLLMHAVVQNGYYPRSQYATEQTIEVIRRFDLLRLIAPFTRCLRCNARLEKVGKAEVMEKLKPLTKIYYEEFRRCSGCGQIYWPGSHFSKLQKRIGELHAQFSKSAA